MRLQRLAFIVFTAMILAAAKVPAAVITFSDRADFNTLASSRRFFTFKDTAVGEYDSLALTNTEFPQNNVTLTAGHAGGLIVFNDWLVPSGQFENMASFNDTYASAISFTNSTIGVGLEFATTSTRTDKYVNVVVVSTNGTDTDRDGVSFLVKMISDGQYQTFEGVVVKAPGWYISSIEFPAAPDNGTSSFLANVTTATQLEVVPEPAALALLAVGGLPLLGRRRR